METYLVGGAVRDTLLGLPVRERDWVVVGSSPEAMRAAGFTQVGKDFPVFLHPETREEHALARTERKTGHGHKGFVVHCDPQVTLEDDLLRRDLTINAIAQRADGELVDPHGGLADIDGRVLRHVSEAFAEDPLRVLRTARFAARFQHLGFTVADDTLALMRDITTAGELAHLPAERVWSELERALGETSPGAFISVLRDCGALAAILPEVDALFGVPQRAEYHPEIDTGVHVLMVLEQAARLGGGPRVAFAALTHDLGKGLTPAQLLPSHRGHEASGLPLVETLCRRLKAPNSYRQLALSVCEHHLLGHRARELRGDTLLRLLTATGAFREGEQFEQFLLACEADSRGREGLQDQDYPQAAYLREAAAVAREVGADTFLRAGISGKAVGDAMRREQIQRLNRYREQCANQT